MPQLRIPLHAGSILLKPCMSYVILHDPHQELMSSANLVMFISSCPYVPVEIPRNNHHFQFNHTPPLLSCYTSRAAFHKQQECNTHCY